MWRMTPVIIQPRIKLLPVRTIITRIHTFTARLMTARSYGLGPSITMPTVRATTAPEPFTAIGINLRRAVG